MALLEGALDLGFGKVHLIGVGDADPDRANALALHEVVLRRRQWDEHLVVLAERPRRAFCLQNAGDLEGQSADRDLAANRGRVEAKVVGGGRAQHGDPKAGVDARVGQERALPDRVGADRHEVGRRPDDIRRRVEGACLDELLGGDLGLNGGDAVQRRDRLGVIDRQRRG